MKPTKDGFLLKTIKKHNIQNVNLSKNNLLTNNAILYLELFWVCQGFPIILK